MSIFTIVLVSTTFPIPPLRSMMVKKGVWKMSSQVVRVESPRVVSSMRCLGRAYMTILKSGSILVRSWVLVMMSASCMFLEIQSRWWMLLVSPSRTKWKCLAMWRDFRVRRVDLLIATVAALSTQRIVGENCKTCSTHVRSGMFQDSEYRRWAFGWRQLSSLQLKRSCIQLRRMT